ncbi:hypothetical protein ZIOFF_012163 [Zingiber officinale]|uniref:Uncharacterized protein n=1 Tax=Zingiber officinale TaxID=94328 RepID=A0A8J5HPG5_ZINOF|nr:hypothetical protein ZIOFF_012163 [Zingiber officinale]
MLVKMTTKKFVSKQVKYVVSEPKTPMPIPSFSPRATPNSSPLFAEFLSSSHHRRTLPLFISRRRYLFPNLSSFPLLFADPPCRRLLVAEVLTAPIATRAPPAAVLIFARLCPRAIAASPVL